MRLSLNCAARAGPAGIDAMPANQNSNSLPPLIQPVLFAGFASSVAIWCAWFITHIPWLKLDESATLPAIIAVWFVALATFTRFAAPRRSLKAGLLAGLASALVGLLILGSKLAERADPSGASAGARPNAAIIALGFLAFGAVLGLVAGAAGRILPLAPAANDQPQPWLARFALVAVAAGAPLLFIGGLVTSTNSGMAVPDWPNTFGSNMFLYPLGPRTPPDRYLEHAHRLFGTLLGLTTLVALIWTLAARIKGWPRIVAWIVFALVCVQGLLGGARVHFQTALAGSNPESAARIGRLLAFCHGILAQVTFAFIIALAVYLHPCWRAKPEPGIATYARARRVRILATATLHTLAVQLLLGAMARHFRGSNHPVWAHIGFSILVVALASMAGAAASSIRGPGGIHLMRRWALWLSPIAGVQFLIGWGAFFVRGKTIQSADPLEALIRTAHQANGAILLAVATATFVWARWLARGAKAQETDQPAREPANSPASSQAPAVSA